MDGRNPAPLKKPWNDDSPVNIDKQLFSWVQSGAGLRLFTTFGLELFKHPSGLLTSLTRESRNMRRNGQFPSVP